ncbi:GtrA family protein, partial [Patescibacteria group bacterium]|nr:GtrA family protein [Patescibacteria group bacterium]
MDEPSFFSPKYWLDQPIVRFAGVGFLSTVIDIGLLNLLNYLGVNIYVATAVAFITAMTNGYLLNSRFVFSQERSYQRYIKYCIVSAVGLVLTELI